MTKVLVVDDEPDMRWLLSSLLKNQGFEVALARDGQEALERVSKETPQVVLLDIKMPRMDGMEALQKFKEAYPQLPAIILTAYGDVQSAVQAMKLGAYDYLTKPFNNDDLIFTINRALEKVKLLNEVASLQVMIKNGTGLQEVMGSSSMIRRVFQQIQQVAVTNFTVILQGETGTGKEIVARAIHQHSLRREKPFVALDCGAIPETLIESELFGYEKGAFTGAHRRKEGHFELASGGTLFLDEIANLPLTTQGKLLRTLQERYVQRLGATKPIMVDVRILVASNKILEEEVKAGRFREDLFHRLNEFTITIPPLRERKEDILYLAKLFLDEARMELRKNLRGLSKDAIELLLSYPWPGNARELKNVIRRAVLLSQDIIEPGHLSIFGVNHLVPQVVIEPEVKAGVSLREICDKAAAEVEKQVIQQVLKATMGNKSQAAKLLRIDYKTLHNKIKRYGIRAMEFMP
mgnify:CR=1 FL=1